MIQYLMMPAYIDILNISIIIYTNNRYILLAVSKAYYFKYKDWVE